MRKEEMTKKDRLGVIAEDISSKFSLAMESHSILVKKIDGMSEKIDKLDERLTDFQTETASNFETVFNYLSAMEPQSGKIEDLENRMLFAEKQLAKN